MADALGGRVVAGGYTLELDAEHGAVVRPAPEDAIPVPRVRETVAGESPPPVPRLLGREEELRAAREGLQSGGPVEVVGEPGIGRTALLSDLAQPEGAPQGVLFLRVAGLPGEDILQLLFESFHESAEPVVATPTELAHALRDRRALVVLDDADLARSELDRVIRMAPGCAFAVAATEPRLYGGGRSIGLGGLDEASCLTLAEDELGRRPSESEQASLAQLAQAVAGHPLRIRQAAHLMIEGRRPRSEPEGGPRSPRDEFDELLGLSVEGDEEGVLGPMSVLPGVALEPDRIARITGVSGTSGVLEALERRGLVRAHGRRRSLVETVSAALGRRLDTDTWRARLVEDFARPGSEPSVDEVPAVLALLDAAAEAGEHEGVIQVARNANRPLALGARWGAWRKALDRTVVAARQLGDRRSEAWALHQLGARAGCLGDLPGATTILEEAVRFCESLGDGTGAGLARQNLEALQAGGAAPALRAPSRPLSMPVGVRPSVPFSVPRTAPVAPPPPRTPPPPPPATRSPAPPSPPAPADAPAPAEVPASAQGPPPVEAPPPAETQPPVEVQPPGGAQPPAEAPAPPPQAPPLAPPPGAQPPAPPESPPPAAEPSPGPSSTLFPSPSPTAPAPTGASPAPAAPPSGPPPSQPRTRPAPAEPPSSEPFWKRLPEPAELPLKPILAGAAGILLLVLLVMVVTGGDEESSSTADNEVTVDATPEPNARGRRARRRPLPRLPAVIAPRTLNFTAPLARRSKPQFVTAKNDAGARIRLGKVRLVGRDRRDFVLLEGCSDTRLSRGQNCQAVVSFVPKHPRRGQRPGPRTASLTFTDDGQTGRQTISLNGTVAP